MTNPEGLQEGEGPPLLDDSDIEAFTSATFQNVEAVARVLRFLATWLTGPEAATAEGLKQASFQRYRVMPPTFDAMTLALWRGALNQGKFDDWTGRLGMSEQAVDTELQARRPLTVEGEIRQLWTRGYLDDATASTLAERLGWDAGEFARAQVLAQRFPELEIVHELLRRGEITEQEGLEKLRQLGYQEGETERLLNLAFYIPPVSDLVTMAVRDVFSTDIRAFLQLDDDFPESMLEKFSAAGVSEEVARDYWAAHWALPSLSEAYRMLWRGLITEDDLGLIMRAADILPRFRQPLVDAAYLTPTRVDIRRFHALGLIDEGELRELYMLRGFAPRWADLMTRFTVAYNTAPEPEEEAEVRELSLAQLRRLYKASVINSEAYEAAMQELGYVADDAHALRVLDDMDQAEDVLDDEVDSIRARYLAGALGVNEAIEAMDSLDLPATRVETELADLQRREIARQTAPPRSVIEDMAGRAIISGEELVDELVRQGWSEEWAQRRLLALTSAWTEKAEREQAQRDREQASAERIVRKMLTPSQVARYYSTGALDATQAQAYLESLGYSPGDALIQLEHAGTIISAGVLSSLLEGNAITEEQALVVLRETGYSDADAALVLSTLLPEEPEPEPEPEPEKPTDLPRALVGKLYVEGYIDRANAEARWTRMGLPANSVQVLLMRADDEIAAAQEKKEAEDAAAANDATTGDAS